MSKWTVRILTTIAAAYAANEVIRWFLLVPAEERAAVLSVIGRGILIACGIWVVILGVLGLMIYLLLRSTTPVDPYQDEDLQRMMKGGRTGISGREEANE